MRGIVKNLMSLLCNPNISLRLSIILIGVYASFKLGNKFENYVLRYKSFLLLVVSKGFIVLCAGTHYAI